MRLIDADKLKIRNVSADYWYTVRGVTEDDIDNAPTVNAIPIEWMYEWRMKNNEQYNVGVSSFSQMISDWEKENDSDDTIRI